MMRVYSLQSDQCCDHLEKDEAPSLHPELQDMNSSEQDKLMTVRSMEMREKLDGCVWTNNEARILTTDLRSDLAVKVDDMDFRLHKVALLSKSGLVNRLVWESRDTGKDHIELKGFPGGLKAFELAAKFCYGIGFELTASNVASLRCAAEYLEMTEDLEEGNLVVKTEEFLSFALKTWHECIIILQSCRDLSPWDENLHIVARCVDSIAAQACSDHARRVAWSFIDHDSDKEIASDLDTINHDDRLSFRARKVLTHAAHNWWFEDISNLFINHFVKVISAIEGNGMDYLVIGAVVTYYAFKWIPGIFKDDNADSIMTWSGSIKRDDAARNLQSNNLMMLECIVSILPARKCAVSCSFLISLLRFAREHFASRKCTLDLEKRVAMQLEQATLSELLIPSRESTCKTFYDVGLVLTLLDHYLLQRKKAPAKEKSDIISTANHNSLFKVAKLVDDYLAEVATDGNLCPAKFLLLAEKLPNYARLSHDSLYRAIDIYLKTHTELTDYEHKKLCRAMDCKKLSSDACFHAIQNERLPLRTIVQIMYCEHLKMRTSASDHACTVQKEQDEADRHHLRNPLMLPNSKQAIRNLLSSSQEDIRSVRYDISAIQDEFVQMQHQFSSILRQLEKLNTHNRSYFPWSLGWKKLSSKLGSGRMSQQHERQGEAGEKGSQHSSRSRLSLRGWRKTIG